jgi:hypothetical protein
MNIPECKIDEDPPSLFHSWTFTSIHKYNNPHYNYQPTQLQLQLQVDSSALGSVGSYLATYKEPVAPPRLNLKDVQDSRQKRF